MTCFKRKSKLIITFAVYHFIMTIFNVLNFYLNLKNNNFSQLYSLILIYILGRTSSAMAAEGKPDPEPNDQGLQAELVSLRSQAEALRQDLKACKDELQKLQKQLSQSERLQKTTESYNEDLRQQVSQVLVENRGSFLGHFYD